MSDARARTNARIPDQKPAAWDGHALLAVALGIAVTLVVRGYRFETGNHTVYLLAPLRIVHPELLRHDWFATQTLQYHGAFTLLAATLMRWGILQPAFAALYLALVLLLHSGWLRLTCDLGLSVRHYLLSVLLYYLSAAGLGLGSYEFLQDGSFLPGNVANVAMLWGVRYWIIGRPGRAGASLALAALFHLNHALVAIPFWVAGEGAAWILRRLRSRAKEGSMIGTPNSTKANGIDHRGFSGALRLFRGAIPFLVIGLAALPGILPAAHLALSDRPRMELTEFVDLYVRLRHPHHYDPLSWPVALWLCFLWPIPLAVVAFRRAEGVLKHTVQHRLAFAFGFFLVLQLIALLFAGVWFAAESLIQMSLFRFSIYPKLLACIGAAVVLLNWRGREWLRATPFLLLGIVVLLLRSGKGPLANFAVINLAAMLLLATVSWPITFLATRPGPIHLKARWAATLSLLGLAPLLFFTWRGDLGIALPMDKTDDRALLELCHWARDRTPQDAVFLVPPDEQLFRYHARRAIVVNFKCVPQLSSEMPTWKERMEAVLDLPLAQLPRQYEWTHVTIALHYNILEAEHLQRVARRYGATYILTRTPMHGGKCIFENAWGRLYHLHAEGDPAWMHKPSPG